MFPAFTYNYIIVCGIVRLFNAFITASNNKTMAVIVFAISVQKSAKKVFAFSVYLA